jgi:antitoxin component YwqK of YwqJK toxin-antitoxin module
MKKTYYDNGRPKIIDYRDELRVDGLSIEQFWENGNRKTIEHRDENNNLSKEGLPALQTFHENGNLKTVSYFTNGKLDRIGNTAYQEFNEKGVLTKESYYKKGDLLLEKVITPLEEPKALLPEKRFSGLLNKFAKKFQVPEEPKATYTFHN